MERAGENTGKYVALSVPTRKELANDKTVTYKIKFIEGLNFMGSSLWVLVDDLAEELHNGECKDCNSLLEYIKM